MIEIRSCKFWDHACSKEVVFGEVLELRQLGGSACSECLLRHLARACSLAEVRQPGGSYGRMLHELWHAVIQRIGRDGASDSLGGGV